MRTVYSQYTDDEFIKVMRSMLGNDVAQEAASRLEATQPQPSISLVGVSLKDLTYFQPDTQQDIFK